MGEIEERISACFRAQGLLALLEAELVHVSEGEVHIALSPHPAICQQPGRIHAGALASILDSACGFAAMTVAQRGHAVLTVEYKLKFIRPAPHGERFVAVGKVVAPGKPLTTCQGEIVGQQGAQRDAIAVMKATVLDVPPEA